MSLFTRIRPAGADRDAQRARVLRLLSLLLQYPDAELSAASAELAGAVAALPPTPAARHLARFTDWFVQEPAHEREKHYVDVFDLRRRTGLHLTYYLHGDTRRRGLALLALAQSYRALGWEVADGELPDHLPVALEFAAVAGPGPGEAPLRRHRRGLQLIHHALRDLDSPYRHLLAALLALLPPPTAADREAVRRLAAAGPPVEEVGLTPYGTPPPTPEAPR
ncbi:nitrate reductase molybdenum cofactor assembly chaperone [Streptomyces gamaensis]|uniref:Nitrate reductase molybdenum cofactor assembly chaperone n=1 Tax=Streptomyces gamaensis TaxID=1763542 RepID=A0ABW0YZJ8_9ACTN